MKLSFQTILGAIFSLIIPGLGHFLCGAFMWGFFWLLIGIVSGGIANFIACIHIFMLENK